MEQTNFFWLVGFGTSCFVFTLGAIVMVIVLWNGVKSLIIKVKKAIHDDLLEEMAKEWKPTR